MLMRRLKESIHFFREFLAKPGKVGSVAPSSRYLARALTTPLSQNRQPVNILELGAGTGAVTRFIAPLLDGHDRLDICEANRQLAAVVRKHCLEQGPLRQPYQEGRVRLFDDYIQKVEGLLDARI